MTSPDPSRTIAALARDKVNLDLKTVDLCFLAGATWLADREPALERVLPDLPMPRLPVWLAVHREIRSSARIRALYDFLAEGIPAALA
jgi:DNA-binding transcriptional LysR family regulator